jgi:hypothetical protein
MANDGLLKSSANYRALKDVFFWRAEKEGSGMSAEALGAIRSLIELLDAAISRYYIDISDNWETYLTTTHPIIKELSMVKEGDEWVQSPRVQSFQPFVVPKFTHADLYESTVSEDMEEAELEAAITSAADAGCAQYDKMMRYDWMGMQE